MKKLNYTKAIIIVHGKSEKILCEYIKSNLRLKIEIYSDKNGEKSIQITSLKHILNNKIFKSFTALTKMYSGIQLSNDKKSLNQDFKIFIIMDTDDCSESQKIDFINKKMFKNHWAYSNIVPIYNTPELETVLESSGIPFKKTGDKRKKEYIKLFPTNKNYDKSDETQIKELLKILKKQKNTNLDEFLNFCLKSSN